MIEWLLHSKKTALPPSSNTRNKQDCSTYWLFRSDSVMKSVSCFALAQTVRPQNWTWWWCCRLSFEIIDCRRIWRVAWCAWTRQARPGRRLSLEESGDKLKAKTILDFVLYKPDCLYLSLRENPSLCRSEDPALICIPSHKTCRQDHDERYKSFSLLS
jgi:hypothetical protein